MKRLMASIAVAVVLCMGWSCMSAVYAEWEGVDEAVVKKFAEQAGRPPRDPYINTARGDMLLFCFLLAGAVGGFAGGYCFRELFPPKAKDL